MGKVYYVDFKDGCTCKTDNQGKKAWTKLQNNLDRHNHQDFTIMNQGGEIIGYCISGNRLQVSLKDPFMSLVDLLGFVNLNDPTDAGDHTNFHF